MGAAVIILRELKVASRRRGTWGLRTVFAVGMALAFLLALIFDVPGPQERGRLAFGFLAVVGFVLCLGAGSYLTADSISFERREGTLGLLFLTPLNAFQIVLGKMAMHSLQVAFVVLGMLPFLFLPVLLGGVIWEQVVRLMLALLMVLFLSLATGMLWSTLRVENTHTAVATLVTVVLMSVVPWVVPLVGELLGMDPGWFAAPVLVSPLVPLLTCLEPITGRPWGKVMGPRADSVVFWMSWGVQVVLAVGTVLAAGIRLRTNWRRGLVDALVSAAPSRGDRDDLKWMKKAGVGGEFGTRFRTRPRRGSAASAEPEMPLVWLASRSLGEGVGFRMLREVALLFFWLALTMAVLTRRAEGALWMACLTALGLHAMTRLQASWMASRWLHQERRSGALELLLTTPVRDVEVIEAHHRALRRRFRKPVGWLVTMNIALMLAEFFFWEHLHLGDSLGQILSTFMIGGTIITLADFPAVRWLGLRQACGQGTLAKAAGRTFLALQGVPWLVLVIVMVILSRGVWPSTFLALLAGWYAFCLANDLRLIWACRRWVTADMRSRLAESA